MKKVLVIAPHPDDETLGCGGTLLRHQAEGCSLHWLIATEMRPELGYSAQEIALRRAEVDAVSLRFGFASTDSLGFAAARLDTEPKGEIIKRMAEVFHRLEPEVVYLPFAGDAHSDHKVVFEAGMACCKWFRFPWVKRVLAYETLSETDANLDPCVTGFRPNVFVDITGFLETKLAILPLFAGETGAFPFPRSARAIRALAEVRGSAAGSQAAEAFMLLREVI